MKEDCLKIIEHYGVNHQQRKLAEEIFELNEAIIQREYPAFRKNEDLELLEKKHIAEELADVETLLDQFKAYYGIGQEEINKNKKFKIERQLQRIKKEQKDE